MSIDLKEIRRKVCGIAIETGSYIRDESSKIGREDVMTKDRNSFVTHVDINAEKHIIKGLKDLIPGSGFITEEDSIADKREEYTWIIDPLDGTTNFIHGIPVYSISIALQHHHHTVLGVVYAVQQDECFSSSFGEKVFLNDSTVKVSGVGALSDSLLATGFPYYDYSKLQNYILFFQECMRSSRGIRRLGSAAIDLAYVACGRYTAFFEYGLNIWDVAAGAFLVNQAGGRVSDFADRDDFIDRREIVATNKNIHQEFILLLNKYFA